MDDSPAPDAPGPHAPGPDAVAPDPPAPDAPAAESGGPLRSPHITRAGLVGMAVLTAVVVAVSLIAGGRDAPVPVPAPSPTPETVTEVISDDISDWEVSGAGTLTPTTRSGATVWTARGKGQATWPRPVADLILDVEFQFPAGRVNAGVITRIPDGDAAGGVEVELDADANGSARVGHIAGLVSPLVYVQPRPKEWHTLTVSVLGERVLVDVDGQHIADWLDMAQGQGQGQGGQGGQGRMADRGRVALRFSDGIRFRAIELSRVTTPS